MNSLNLATFYHCSFCKSAPRIFFSKFRKPSNSSPTQFSNLNYVKTIPKLNKCEDGISYRGPFIWNNFHSTMDKQITDVAELKAVTKPKLLSLENEGSFL